MKLQNKKTGEIGNLVLNTNPNRESYSVLSTENGDTICGNLVVADYDTLAELNKEWEDYEDELLYIISTKHKSGYQCVLKEEYPEICEVAKELGIGFETEKECRKAVEKLKAWTRLKDKGFRFENYMRRSDWAGLPEVLALENLIDITAYLPKDKIEEMKADLDLLFGGEE